MINVHHHTFSNPQVKSVNNILEYSDRSILRDKIGLGKVIDFDGISDIITVCLRQSLELKNDKNQF